MIFRGSFWVTEPNRFVQPAARTSFIARQKSGVRYKGGIHTLRHSFATHLIESGVELPVVQRLMGHASLMTTALYLHVTECRLGEVHSPLDVIDSSHLGR
jgi:site-specific recombinase XerD